MAAITEAEALQRLERMVPGLTQPEYADLLELAERPDTNARLSSADTEWAAAAVYAIGDLVVPTSRTGALFAATTAGAAAGAEPVWPSSGTVVDGAVTWELRDTGARWLPSYDLNAAAAEGWRWRAAKVADAYDFSTDGQSFDRSQLQAHALKMADYYAARVGQLVGSARSGALSIKLSPRAPYYRIRGARGGVDEFGDSDRHN